MGVTYPLFAFEKDDRSMRVIEDSSSILGVCEGIDIENDEYVFWDANGYGVSITASVSFFGDKLTGVIPCAPAFPLQDAFASYVKSVGLSDLVVEGPPIKI